MNATGSPPPQATVGWTRRKFLRSLWLGMLAGASGACRTPGTSHGKTQPDGHAWLAAVIDAPVSAARLGRGYLELHPEEGDANRLAAQIEAAIAVYGPVEPRNTDPDRIIATLQRVVRADYVQDQVVAVSGWVLSRTEARLYALVSLGE